MSSLIRFIARILFVAVLFHSAYHKIMFPDEFKGDIAKGYGRINSLLNHYGISHLPSEAEFSSKAALATKFIGLIEAFIASFILTADWRGGLMAIVYYVIWGIVNFTLLDLQNAHNKTFAQRQKLITWLSLLGGAFVFSNKSYLK